MKNSDVVAEAFGSVLERYAKENGITLQEAFNIAMTPAAPMTQKEKWGDMPHEYDPSRDSSHPSRGFTSNGFRGY